MKKAVNTGVLIASLVFGTALFAQQQSGGETTFKTKCAACHGPTGEGKIGPALKNTKVGEDDIVLVLSKGKDGMKAPHSKPMTSLSDEQIKAVAHYVKSLK